MNPLAGIGVFMVVFGVAVQVGIASGRMCALLLIVAGRM